MTISLEREPVAASPISIIMVVPPGVKPHQPAIEGMASEVARLGRACEILITPADGPASVPEWSRGIGSVRWLLPEASTGYGVALAAGIKAAGYPLIFTMPATSEYEPSCLPRFLAVVDQVDIVTGSRKGRSRFARRTGGWMAYWIFGVPVPDAACPVRLYRRSVFERLPIQCRGAYAEIEIVAKANFMNCLLTEVEVPWHPAGAVTAGYVPGDARQLFIDPHFAANPAPAQNS